MSKPRSANLVLLAAVTIFVSAFLLFQVQPLISKKILPWFGGSPAVWTTCMLFFQVLLLGGYTYAHLLTKCVTPKWQGRIHAALLVLAVVTLPIIPSDWWKPSDGRMPAARILVLLAAEVGIPYFLLSTTGPLIQAWFALANPGKSPYRLYALSNIGSLGALLTYPFIFEYYLTVDWQGWLWSGAFVFFALLAGTMGLIIWRVAAALELPDPLPASSAGLPPKPADLQSPPWYHQLGWVLLAALPSMAFLAITNHLCQDVAPVPLLFIVPLSLYLLTLIICFDREAWYSRVFFGVFGALVLALLCGLEIADKLDEKLIEWQSNVGFKEQLTFTEVVNWLLEIPQQIVFVLNRLFGQNWQFELPFSVEGYEDDVYFQAVMYLIVLFFGCMLCHGELVKLKPAPRHLTKYYLLISAGGALGGLFVALISPSLFVRPYELHLSLVGCFAVAMLALFAAGQWFTFARQEMVQWSAAFMCAGFLILIAAAQYTTIGRDDENIVKRARNFYGMIHVERQTFEGNDGEELQGLALYHGRILHGFQYTTPGKMDTISTYYGPNSGPGLAVRHHPTRVAGGPLSVAVVGLGTGTMAGFAEAGDFFCFYDIDPKIVELHDEGTFQFVQRARARGADVPILLGDARLTMEREAKAKSKQYDLIVLDAFSGDAIPAHLLTLEAVKIYDELLRVDAEGRSTGILAVHISNRYLDLAPVVDALAAKYGFQQVPVDDEGSGDPKATSSNWILLTRNQEFLDDVIVKAAAIASTPVANWEVLMPQSFSSQGGAKGMIASDGSILVGGPAPDKDTYTIQFDTSLAEIAGIRVEALTDESLPCRGPGRKEGEPNFVLTGVEVRAGEHGQKTLPLLLREASADFSREPFAVEGAIDNDPATGWSIAPHVGQDHEATFMFTEPLLPATRRTITLKLVQNAGGGQTIGKLRVSAFGVEKKPPLLWTDQYSSLWEILK